MRYFSHTGDFGRGRGASARACGGCGCRAHLGSIQEGVGEADAGEHDPQWHALLQHEPAAEAEQDDEAEVDGAAVRRLEPRLGVRKLHARLVRRLDLQHESLPLQVLACMRTTPLATRTAAPTCGMHLRPACRHACRSGEPAPPTACVQTETAAGGMQRGWTERLLSRMHEWRAWCTPPPVPQGRRADGAGGAGQCARASLRRRRGGPRTCEGPDGADVGERLAGDAREAAQRGGETRLDAFSDLAVHRGGDGGADDDGREHGREVPREAEEHAHAAGRLHHRSQPAVPRDAPAALPRREAHEAAAAPRGRTC